MIDLGHSEHLPFLLWIDWSLPKDKCIVRLFQYVPPFLGNFPCCFQGILTLFLGIFSVSYTALCGTNWIMCSTCRTEATAKSFYRFWRHGLSYCKQANIRSKNHFAWQYQTDAHGKPCIRLPSQNTRAFFPQNHIAYSQTNLPIQLHAVPGSR